MNIKEIKKVVSKKTSIVSKPKIFILNKTDNTKFNSKIQQHCSVLFITKLA